MELRGHEDHGVGPLPRIAERHRAGYFNPRPDVRLVRQSDTVATFDADRAYRVVPSTIAMRWCIERARERRGIAAAAVRNSGHFCAGAPYVAMAAETGRSVSPASTARRGWRRSAA